MEKLTVCFFILLLALGSFGQSTTVKPDLSYDQYMKKSVRQNKLGWILLGGGIGVSTAAILLATQLDVDNHATFVLVGIGVCMFTITTPLSIPFFFLGTS